MVKLLGRSLPDSYHNALVFTVMMHGMLVLALLREYEYHCSIDSQAITRRLKNILASLGRANYNGLLEDLNELVSLSFTSTYQKMLKMADQRIRKNLHTFSKTILKGNESSMEERAGRNVEAFVAVGQCAFQYIVMALSEGENPMADLRFDKAFNRKNECRVLHKVWLLGNMQGLLMAESLTFVPIYYLQQRGGLESLYNLYQWTVNQLSACDITQTSPLVLELQILASCLVVIFARLMSPANLQSFYDATWSNIIGRDMRRNKFNRPQGFAVPFFAHLFELLFSKTRYSKHKNAVHFLATCAEPGFTRFLVMVGQHTKKKARNQLLLNLRRNTDEDGNESSTRPIPPEVLERFQAMGFDTAKATEIFRRTNFDIEETINLLLSGESLPAEDSRTSMIASIPPKDAARVLEGWLECVVWSLCERLYSIASYKCEDLLHSLLSRQAFRGRCKHYQSLVFFANQLFLLLSELNPHNIFHSLPNPGYPLNTLADADVDVPQNTPSFSLYPTYPVLC